MESYDCSLTVYVFNAMVNPPAKRLATHFFDHSSIIVSIPDATATGPYADHSAHVAHRLQHSPHVVSLDYLLDSRAPPLFSQLYLGLPPTFTHEMSRLPDADDVSCRATETHRHYQCSEICAQTSHNTHAVRHLSLRMTPSNGSGSRFNRNRTILKHTQHSQAMIRGNI